MASLIEAFAYYRCHPVEFVKDVIGATPTSDQVEVLTNLADSKFIAVKSGHGIGKTAVEAWAILWFISTRPMSKIPCTAPTGHQLDDILWPEVATWLQKSNLKSFITWTKTKLFITGHESEWFAVPRSCSVPENLQGFHGPEILFVIDEASGVPQDIMEVIEGALTNSGARLLMCGNPTRTSGTFFDAFHRDRTLYKTHTFSSERSRLVSKEYCDRVAQKFGRESDVYRVRVLGEFPKGEPDALITLADIEPAINRSVEPGGVCQIGVDPARYGSDMSVICIRMGNDVKPFVEFSGINTTRLSAEVFRVVQALRNENPQLGKIRVCVDDTGVGGGVTDQLQENARRNNIEIVPVNFGGASTSTDYADKGAELWGGVKQALKELSIPDDSELIAQLTTRKYTLNPVGKIKLERKEDMKRRGLVSPDRGDALALACDNTGYGETHQFMKRR